MNVNFEEKRLFDILKNLENQLEDKMRQNPNNLLTKRGVLWVKRGQQASIDENEVLLKEIRRLESMLDRNGYVRNAEEAEFQPAPFQQSSGFYNPRQNYYYPAQGHNADPVSFRPLKNGVIKRNSATKKAVVPTDAKFTSQRAQLVHSRKQMMAMLQNLENVLDQATVDMGFYPIDLRGPGQQTNYMKSMVRDNGLDLYRKRFDSLNSEDESKMNQFMMQRYGF